jgi:cytochrome c peroxidase
MSAIFVVHPATDRYTRPMLSNITRRALLGCLAIATLSSASCEPAKQYHPIARAVKDAPKKDIALPALWRWLPPHDRRDVPIVFVPDSSAEWASLKSYWNPPAQREALAVAPFAQPTLPALTAVLAAERHLAIKIKVPRGLPDPTPHIAAANPPTEGKWTLGKRLFHAPILLIGVDVYSCASCHDPRRGFSEPVLHSLTGTRDALGLINVVYNRRQFWDGRVETLEETIVRSLEDERPVDPDRGRLRAIQQHIFGGLISRLGKKADYVAEFKHVFGIDHPTQDAVGQSLATYMRTILSGDSIYDRADEARRGKKAPALIADHFKEALTDAKLAERLKDDEVVFPTKEEPHVRIFKGYELFHGKARCTICHTGALFTDQDYHNIGYSGAESLPGPGKETGRALQVPIGLKESRLVGAFRTPSLRNLPRTNPYLHNGSMFTLMRMVEHYDTKIAYSSHLASALKQGEHRQTLDLSDDEKETLVLFLRSLEGSPVDPILIDPTR